MKNQYLGKQQQYQHQISSPRNPNKKSLAQEYLKEKRSVHQFDISSDSDEEDSEFQDTPIQRYGSKKADSPLSQSYKNNSRVTQYTNKDQEIYALNLKIFALENEFLAQKQKLIEKYEKQLFDVNRQKSFLQEEKGKLMKQIDSLNKKNKKQEQEIEQLKQQLQIFIGQNRKTPNFNSMPKDFGQSELITILTSKDQKIKDLEQKLEHLSIQKEHIQTSLTQSFKPDRSSGESFGGNRNNYLISFGEIEENLKKTQNSLKQSNKIKESLTKEIQDIKNQLTKQKEHSNLLMEENSSLENDRQAKAKEIQLLSEKLSKSQNKQYLLQKELQNFNKKLNINEDLLQIKEKQVQKLNQMLQELSQRIQKTKKQNQKNEKQWYSRLSKLQNDKSMSLNEKIEERKKDQLKFLSKIESLTAENKKNLSTLQELAVRQQRVKVELSKVQKQRDQVQKKLQQSIKQHAKIKHTCKIQEERILELQNDLNTLKNEKKSLKEEAEKIMRKQKNEITTLKQSLELMVEKSKKVEQKMKKQEEQVKSKEESLNAIKSEIQVLKKNLREEINEKEKLSTENEKLSISIRNHEEVILRLKQENYELNKQIERKKQLMNEKDRQSKEMIQIYQNNQKQQNIQKALHALQSQYRILETKFDKQTTQKEQMVEALGEKIKYYEQRINQDSIRYQETLNEKNYLFKQAESLTQKCKEMFDYIQKMQQNQNKKSEGKIKGSKQSLEDAKNMKQNKEQTQQLQRENVALKQEIYRISQQMQELKSMYRTELQRIQSYVSPPQSSRKPQRQITVSQKSSSLNSSYHDRHPMESVVELLKSQKEQMLQTIEYQNKMIQQLQQEMGNAMTMLQQKNEKNEVNEKQILEKEYQRNRQMLQGKLQEISREIEEKQKQMIHMKQLNEKISEQLKEMSQNHKEQLSKMQLEMNLLKEEKKQLHEELDLAHEQLIVYEKERSKDKMAIVNEIRTQLQAKVSFINDDVQKYKLETKKHREEIKKLEQDYQVQIQARQQLYLKERQKLTSEIQTLNKDLNQLQEKLKKANMIIGQEKHRQSQNHSQNQYLQMEFLEILKLNRIYQQDIQSLKDQIQNLHFQNEKITRVLHQFDDKNNLLVAEMQAQIEKLFKQKENYRQIVQKQKSRLNNLEIINAEISTESHKKSSSAFQSTAFKEPQRLEKGTILNVGNARTFPNHEDTFFIIENPKPKVQMKIFSQPIHNQKKVLNLYDTPQKGHVTFKSRQMEGPRQEMHSKSQTSSISFKPQNFSLTSYKTYQSSEKKQFTKQRRSYVPLQKEKVEFYRI